MEGAKRTTFACIRWLHATRNNKIGGRCVTPTDRESGTAVEASPNENRRQSSQFIRKDVGFRLVIAGARRNQPIVTEGPDVFGEMKLILEGQMDLMRQMVKAAEGTQKNTAKPNRSQPTRDLEGAANAANTDAVAEGVGHDRRQQSRV